MDEERSELEDANAPAEVPVKRLERVKQCLMRRLAERWVRLGLVFVLGVALGVIVKTEAGPRLTMGFLDYTVERGVNRIDLNAAQARAMAAGASDVTAPSGIATGGSCGQ